MSVVLSQPNQLSRRARRGGACLGIDIGTSGIKLAEVVAHRKGPRWLSRAYRRFPHPLPDTPLEVSSLAKLVGDQLPRSSDGVQRSAIVFDTEPMVRHSPG